LADAGSFVLKAGDTMTGALQIVDGTAAAPAIHYATDTDTGIYLANADSFGIVTGGVNRAYANNAGWVVLGNVLTSGNSRRWGGDLSNATLSYRALWRDSTTNAATSVGAIPNGTGAFSEWIAYNNSTPTNAGFVAMKADASYVYLISTRAGTGTTPPLLIQTGDTPATRIRLNSTGTGYYGCAEYDAGNSGTSLTLDFNSGQNQKVTLTGNVTFTFSNPVAGMTAKIKLVQDATGSRAVTWPTIKWAGGAAPTLTGTAGSIDIITLYYDGSSYFGMAGLKFA
jgi:hypothetical protein